MTVRASHKTSYRDQVLTETGIAIPLDVTYNSDDPLHIRRAMACPPLWRTVTQSGDVHLTIPTAVSGATPIYPGETTGLGPWYIDGRAERQMRSLDDVLEWAYELVARWRQRAQAHAEEQARAAAERAAQVNAEAERICAEFLALPEAERAVDGRVCLPTTMDKDVEEAVVQRLGDAYTAAAKAAAEQAAAKAAAERAAKEEAWRAKLARRAELGAVEIHISRGDRDWGVPWGAVVRSARPGSRRDTYDFTPASYDLRTEVLTIRCQPGDIIAWGQRNYRRPKRSIHERRLVNPDWSLTTI